MSENTQELWGKHEMCRAGLRNALQFVFSAINISAHLSTREGNVSLRQTEIFRPKELHLEAFVK